MLLQQNSQQACMAALPCAKPSLPSTRGLTGHHKHQPPSQLVMSSQHAPSSSSSCAKHRCRDVHARSYRRNVMSTDFPDAPFNRTHAFDWLDQWYPVGFIK
jgi:hypothetical protein